MYCKAFGTEISYEIKDESQIAYAYCELKVNGQLFMAVSEAPSTCDVSKKSAWQTMAFNVYDMGSEEAVHNAYDILRDGGTVIDTLRSCDWKRVVLI